MAQSRHASETQKKLSMTGGERFLMYCNGLWAGGASFLLYYRRRLQSFSWLFLLFLFRRFPLFCLTTSESLTGLLTVVLVVNGQDLSCMN
jgi:hypothetical protein